MAKKESSDVAEKGYKRMDFGADEKENHLIRDAYVKQAEPTESEETDLPRIALHEQVSHFYSDKKKGK